MSVHEDLLATYDAVAEAERKRIAAWLNAKADETEHYMRVAAARGEPELKHAQELFAVKSRVLLHVIARMIEVNALPLRGAPEDLDVPCDDGDTT
jgi:hypothetical protein